VKAFFSIAVGELKSKWEKDWKNKKYGGF